MRNRIWIGSLLLLLCLSLLVSLTLGKYPLGLWEICRYFSPFLPGRPLDPQRKALIGNIVMQIRLPRLEAALLIGAALSVSGGAFQSLFVNPLVSPSLLGVLAGASFGASLGIVTSGNWLVVQALTLFFGLLAVLISLALAGVYRGDRMLMLLLGGVISGALFTSLLAVVKYLADPYNQLPAIVYWLMGGLSMVDAATVASACLPMTIGLALILLLAPYLNILSMGEDEALSLGIPVRRIRLLVILCATGLSALTVVLGGIIGWVGLIIPHLARFLVGPDNRVLLPVAALLGALYLVIADDLARLLFSSEIPLGILTSLLGIPFLALVLRNAQKAWG